MIGVIADPSEHAVLREFFELFKTPWELYRRGSEYEVLLSIGDGEYDEASASLVLIYAGRKLRSDEHNNIQLAAQRDPGFISQNGIKLPIYGDNVLFTNTGDAWAGEQACHSPLHVIRRGGRVVAARIGYDLAAEVRALLVDGQPAANANIPALEQHIALLRGLILDSGIPLVEIPPVPDNYRFIVCLTHDVDHPSIRRHKFDHTMFGFLYRAVFGTLVDAFCGRAPLNHVWVNWAAALKLPFIHAGLAKDYWYTFDRYVEIENGLPSSFFVIPFKNYPGKTHDGPAPARRASRYGAADIADCLHRLMAAGCEIGLHGLDAWIDRSKAREELDQVVRLTGTDEVGVRMHWLYFDQQSPVTLEEAGASYDSTVGYNETIGYRAGTTQVYKPLETTRLLELPLHIMDTALFYPDYLHLTPAAARKQIAGMINNAVHFGGSVTVNWHDRSIAPERLWADAYVSLIDECKSQGAWFSTAAQAVSWFRQRRSASFEVARQESDTLHAKVKFTGEAGLPGLRLRIHHPRGPNRTADISDTYRDISLTADLDAPIAV